MKVLITGADGFIGKNLQLHLSENRTLAVAHFTRKTSAGELSALARDVDFVFHLAGVNRPGDPAEFLTGNTKLTEMLCGALETEATRTGRKAPIVYTSSTQAKQDTPYGKSKRLAEEALFSMQGRLGYPVHVFRLPNVFGKWAKPNYNSAVATFCHNTARGLPIRVADPSAKLTLVYVDDLVNRFICLLEGADPAHDSEGFATLSPQYTTTVGELANQIEAFKQSRETLLTEAVGSGLKRALYSTYVSYLPPEAFTYPVPMHSDARGLFAEFLKTPDCGQFSYFTALPGKTRGGHYHHTKTEKFLVVQGQARFRFRHKRTGETHEVETSSSKAEIVESVPGWTHDVTNVGPNELVVLLWANEIFDDQRPDTFACPLD